MKLLLLSFSRFGAGISMMAFAGNLANLMPAWNLSVLEAGFIQSSFNFSYALSLLFASWLSDRFGAKRIFIISAVATAITFFVFCEFAKDYHSCLVLYSIVGIFQGGTYTPSIMLVSHEYPSSRRGRAIGWIQGAASLGFLFSIALTVSCGTTIGYRAGLYAAALGPLLGAFTAYAALFNTPNYVPAKSTTGSDPKLSASLLSTSSILLTIGYTAHAWEVIAMWAWMPVFLTSQLQSSLSLNGPWLGLLVATPIHLSGFLATLIAGAASDKFGRRQVLIVTAAAGALLSVAIGWSSGFSAEIIIVLATLYGFATVADSGVLSAAMTETIHPRYLGTLFGLRSILGFGAGAISPTVFAWAYERGALIGTQEAWGYAFLTLGFGGAIATICAILLPKKSKFK